MKSEKIPSELREEFEELCLGSVDVLPEKGLLRLLADGHREGRPLRVKLGVDPTAPDIHLGHTVVLRKLAQFQEYGHTAVLIIGDYTGKVGDPSGRSKTRPQLDEAELDANAVTYIEQAGKVLDMEKVELRRNSEWLSGLDMEAVLRLTSTITVARMLERDDFSNRYAGNEPISMLEFMYPLLQGYDSVVVKADLELGGTDQKFNLLMGRTVMEAYGLPAQSVLTVPLLVGTDGEQKMSKSYDNYIGVSEKPKEMFGKVMSIPDSLMVPYWRLLTGAAKRELEQVEQRLASSEYHPAEAKRDLAERIVSLYHSPEAAKAARQDFDRVFKEKDQPVDMPTVEVPAEVIQDGQVWLPRLLTSLGMVGSNGEARRLIQQGGVRLGGQAVEDVDTELQAESLKGSVLQVGKRKFIKFC